MATTLRSTLVLAGWLGLSSAVALGAETVSLSAWGLDPLELPSAEGLEPSVAGALSEAERSLRALEPSAASERVAETLGETARLLLAHEFWDAAGETLERAIALAPEDFRWCYYRAWTADRAGDTEGALDAYRHCLTLRPEDLPALVRAGRAAIALGELELGRKLLSRARGLSASPAVVAELGKLALEEGRPAEAVTLIESALAGQPAADALYYPLALAYRQLGQEERARQLLERRGTVGVDVVDPLIDDVRAAASGATVAHLRGLQAYRAGRYDDAVVALRQAVAEDPERPEMRLNLAVALAAAGRQDEAIAELESLLARRPEDVTTLYNLALLLESRGELAEAEPLLKRAVRLAPDDREVRLALARVLGSLGRVAESRPLFLALIEQDRHDEVAWFEGATMLLRAELWTEAKAVLERAVTLLPDQGRLLHLLARLLASSPELEQRDGARAVALATTVASAAPVPAHLRTLALALAESGDCPRAAEVQERVVEALEAAGQDASADRRRLDDYRQSPCRP